MKRTSTFSTHERLMLKVGEGWIIRQVRMNHLSTRLVMKHKQYGEDAVSEAALAKLTTLGWLKATPMDALWDTVDYEVTEKGHHALAQLWEAEGEKR